VPVDGQNWTSDPFVADVREGRIYGRGACDMKAFIAVVMAHLSSFATVQLREPIHVALSYDEEVGCLGVAGLLADMKRAGIRPTGCIVGEPTSMRVISAHKGGRIYRCRVHGRAAHSSLTPQGVNAIEYAARVISHIQEIADREEREGDKDAGFDVPFSTISTNLVKGGAGSNIVPADCEFTFEYRHLPGTSPERFIDSIREYAHSQLLPRMRHVCADAAIEFDRLAIIPALDASDTDQILQLALALARQNCSSKVAYGTEASFFQEIGVPSIVCGPGSIEQAHRADEYVTLAQLAQCEGFLARFIAHMTL
jgi:acetylornithine deacetylase